MSLKHNVQELGEEILELNADGIRFSNINKQQSIRVEALKDEVESLR